MILPTTDELGGTCHSTGQGLLGERWGGGGDCSREGGGGMYEDVQICECVLI